LLLEMRDIQQYFELRPQLTEHELVVGRASENSVMVPDIDLGVYGASDLGVSRLHLGLRYEKLDKTICVFDLGSSNGTFLNGLKLYPKEIRVLRHGDELRLGRFMLRIYYRHPGEEIR
jgi:pSer/pThr/pTyr-binding forkhead associated (FHA) protein